MPRALAIPRDIGMGRPVNMSAIMSPTHQSPEATSLTLVKSPIAQMSTMPYVTRKPTGIPPFLLVLSVVGGVVVSAVEFTGEPFAVAADVDMIRPPSDRFVFDVLIDRAARAGVDVLFRVPEGERRIERQHD